MNEKTPIVMNERTPIVMNERSPIGMNAMSLRASIVMNVRVKRKNTSPAPAPPSRRTFVFNDSSLIGRSVMFLNVFFEVIES